MLTNAQEEMLLRETFRNTDAEAVIVKGQLINNLRHLDSIFNLRNANEIPATRVCLEIYRLRPTG